MFDDGMFLKYDTNRLMLVDWSSLAYHQMFSMKSDKNSEEYGMQDEEGELCTWKKKMVLSMIDLIDKFNPKDIVIGIDANSWRKQYVKDYYDKHAIVYHDSSSIYTEADNYAYKIDKVGEGIFEAVRIKPAEYSTFRNLPNKKLGELSPEKNSMLWDIRANGKNPIIPSYKGKRQSSDWPFIVDKHKWQNFKDEFGKEVAKFFRAVAVQVPGAEGDDVLYTGVMRLADNYSSIVMVTHDGDMAQISNPKLHIYDHITDSFTVCSNPTSYLMEKILRGDDSDNIQGMSLPDPKHPDRPQFRQLGPKTASDMVANCEDICSEAKRNGWYDQFVRNKTLIDLSYTSDEIKNNIASCFDFEHAEQADLNGLGEFGISSKLILLAKEYKNRKFYAFMPRSEVDAHPEMFNAEIIRQSNIMDRYSDDEPAAIQPNANQAANGIREFDKITVFEDPLDGVDNITDLF